MHKHTFNYLSKVTARYILDEDMFLEQFGDRKAKEFYKVPIDGGLIYFDPVTAEQFAVMWTPEKTKSRINDFLANKKNLKAHKPKS